jgi:hypothetical protein
VVGSLHVADVAHVCRPPFVPGLLGRFRVVIVKW